MDHSYIDQFDLIDQYLMGKLTEEESAQFEEHYADCQRCYDSLLLTRNFIQDLRTPTALRSLQAAISTRPQKRWQFGRWLAPKPLAIAAICMLVIVLMAAIWTVRSMQRLRSEINQARNEASESRRNYEEAQQAAARSDKRLEEREQELTEQLRLLEARLLRRQELSGRQEAGSSLWLQPGINLPMFSLNSVRRGEPTLPPRGNEVTLPNSPTGFLILIGLEGDANYKGYRFRIVDDRNLTVATRAGLKRNSNNALSIGLNSKLFRPGKYLLMVEGIADDGSAVAAGNYPFRVIKKN